MTTSLGDALTNAIFTNPDDVRAHAAYADWLIDQDDPRGEFIHVQLALEDIKRSSVERRRLKKKEKQLLEKHQRAWLGQLAPYLLDLKADELPTYIQEYKEPRGEFRFARGWLDGLRIHLPTDTLMKVVARSPELRLLRKLIMDDTSWDEGAIPALARSKFLGNVRFLSVNHQGGEFCLGRGLTNLIAKLTRIENIYLHNVAFKRDLFLLPTLANLRILEVHGGLAFPLEPLARNPALGALAELRLWPEGLPSGRETASIRLKHLRAIVRSKVLRSLTHLHLDRSDAGDAGCREIIDSGILSKLKDLACRTDVSPMKGLVCWHVALSCAISNC